jgi:hypothetical protein
VFDRKIWEENLAEKARAIKALMAAWRNGHRH